MGTAAIDQNVVAYMKYVHIAHTDNGSKTIMIASLPS